MNLTFKMLRKRENLKVEYVARQLSISESAYRKYERSARIPQGRTLLQMKKVFKCTDDEIMSALKYHTAHKVND